MHRIHQKRWDRLSPCYSQTTGYSIARCNISIFFENPKFILYLLKLKAQVAKNRVWQGARRDYKRLHLQTWSYKNGLLIWHSLPINWITALLIAHL
jgi:hypothetical protein